MEKIIGLLSNLLNICVNFVILSPFIFLIVAGFGSYYSTGNFLLWISAIPTYLWAILIFLSAVVIIIRRKQKVTKSKNSLSERFLYSPDLGIMAKADFYGATKCAEMRYEDVLWTIEKINESLYLYLDGREPVDTLLVRIPPKCNKCNTDLFESLNFWGGYVWECKRCGFVKKTSQKFLIVGSHALAIAKSEIQEKSQKK